MQLGAAVDRADLTIAEQPADGQLRELLAAQCGIHMGLAVEALAAAHAGEQHRCEGLGAPLLLLVQQATQLLAGGIAIAQLELQALSHL